MLLLVLALVASATRAGVASAQAPSGPAAGTAVSTTSSVVPTLGTAAGPSPASGDVTVETLEPSAINRPLTTSEQRLESLDKWAIGGFVVLSLVVVLVRQRRRRDEIDRDDQPDDERDEWDVALEELTAQYRDEHLDGADDHPAGDR